MKEIISYSPAMLKAFEHCPTKFEYRYIKEINIPINTFNTQQGKNIHALANYYLKNNNIVKLEKVLTKNEQLLWNNLKNNKYFNYEIIQSEYNISSRVGEYWINGRLDALVKNNDEYFILDYKTGQIPQNPELDYQTMVYLLAASKFLENYDELYFVYIDLKNNTNKIIKFDDKLKNIYKEKIINISAEIEKCTKHNIYKANCKNFACEYSKFCQQES